MNKHIKAHIFSIVACLMINACLFAGGPYTSDDIVRILKDKKLPQEQLDIALMTMNNFLVHNLGTDNDGKITQEQLDQIFSIASITSQEETVTPEKKELTVEELRAKRLKHFQNQTSTTSNNND